ncbi:MAG: type II toxin-antitoxin system VapC family toxin [Prosthecobacter sp.]|uniref:type II toxin-antitoxin system VapC family toxin n=1 Tax=Prosthecobacter sp. TaxID=1965333 RepID=UPI003902EB43
MPAYADSSLLLKLYIREPETTAAWQIVNRMQEPLIFTPLHRLEMLNGIRRCIATKKVTRAQAVRAMLLLRSHVQGGRYTLPAVSWRAVFQRAHRLSRKHARTLLVRSLDLLHVALALEIGATEFLTFDDRQKQTASAESMIVTP